MLAGNRRSQGPAGLNGAYGWIYAGCARNEFTAGVGDQLRHLLAAHAARNGLVPVGEPVFQDRETGHLNLTAAARFLGRSFATTRRLLHARNLVPAGIQRGVAALIDEEQVLASGPAWMHCLPGLKRSRDRGNPHLTCAPFRRSARPNEPASSGLRRGA